MGFLNGFWQHMARHIAFEATRAAVNKISDVTAQAKERSARAAIGTVARVFLDSVVAENDAQALDACSGGLRQVLGPPQEAGAALKSLREIVAGLEHLTCEPLELHVREGTAHLAGAATYRGNKHTTFTMDFVHEGEWKVDAYAFSTEPAAAQPVPPTPTPTPKKNVRKNPRGVLPSGNTCPAEHPVKVSQKGIYHVPGGRFYNDVVPVRCFATEAHAQAAGFRASQRG